MTSNTDRIVDDNLQLIDFTEEDDYLIAFPFRDSLEDFRLSVAFDNVNAFEHNKQFEGEKSHVQTELAEPRRPSFLRKSLAWDSAFFNSAGVLNTEELLIINKGFKEAEHNQPISRNGRRTGQNLKTSNIGGIRLETLEGELFEDVKHSIPKYVKRSKVATNIGGPSSGQANVLSCRKVNSSSQNKVKSIRSPISQSLNLLGPKFSSSRKPALEGSNIAKMENKTRKAGTASDMTASKKSRWGDVSNLPKPTSFLSPKNDKDSKLHKSYNSSSSASSSKNLSKSIIKTKISSKNTKPCNSPSSVHFPLSSTCSSSTSSASSIDGWLTEVLASTTLTHQKTIPVSPFQSQSCEQRKLTSNNAIRSSIGTTPPFGGPIRKIKPSGLRMPSPKLGFFDEDPGSMQDYVGRRSPLSNENRLLKLQSSNLSHFLSAENCIKARKTQSKEDYGEKGGSKLKPDRKITKEVSKTRMNKDQKKLKDVTGSFHVIDIKKMKIESDQLDGQKENVFSFEDPVNGLSRHLEVLNLDMDLTEVKGQLSSVKPGQTNLPPSTENSTPFGRTPLAEKMCSK